ncbi:hypothetical protein HY768_08770 [candidate division TA06 bacterium]|uniref:Uncharacterized protein n=1 Tax=candidate division TA06 bacterium TaxID=2250710 RepID=A0A933MK37_UNCT6|nr:hypothetical protein [candidate division TA06 bacterium]
MVKNTEILEKFERELLAQSRLTHGQALAIVEGLRQEAVALGVWPPKNPLEGIEVDIEVARILNSCLKSC